MKTIKWTGLVLVLLAFGCNTPKNTTSWKAPNTIARQFNKILVMGITRGTDRSVQMNMEIHLAGDLQEMGQHAVSTLQEFGPGSFENLDEADALAKLKYYGVDAVITIVLLNKEKEISYIPGDMYHFTNENYYDRFWSYRTALHYRNYEPEYCVTNDKYFWETNFYDLNTRQLLYSVQTQSFNAPTAESLGHQYGQLMVKEMIKNDILKKQDNPNVKVFNNTNRASAK